MIVLKATTVHITMKVININYECQDFKILYDLSRLAFFVFCHTC